MVRKGYENTLLTSGSTVIGSLGCPEITELQNVDSTMPIFTSCSYLSAFPGSIFGVILLEYYPSTVVICDKLNKCIHSY